MTDICRRHGVSRRTGYKWLARFLKEGLDGLSDRSRAPLHRPSVVSSAVIDAILELKDKYKRWGPKKIRTGLQRDYPNLHCPARSTIGEILDRHGLVKHRKKRHKASPSPRPLSPHDHPNDVWCIDFKGWFRTQDRRPCYPLTLCDAMSRFGLLCQGMRGEHSHWVQSSLEKTFREYGLPKVIRSDNGTPFASTGYRRQ